MRFGTFYSDGLKSMVKQVNKTTAKKLIEQGKEIFLHPCSMRFDNMWQSPCPMTRERMDELCASFESMVNEYKYYNCDWERGYYPCFFVRI